MSIVDIIVIGFGTITVTMLAASLRTSAKSKDSITKPTPTTANDERHSGGSKTQTDTPL